MWKVAEPGRNLIGCVIKTSYGDGSPCSYSIRVSDAVTKELIMNYLLTPSTSYVPTRPLVAFLTPQLVESSPTHCSPTGRPKHVGFAFSSPRDFSLFNEAIQRVVSTSNRKNDDFPPAPAVTELNGNNDKSYGEDDYFKFYHSSLEGPILPVMKRCLKSSTDSLRRHRRSLRLSRGDGVLSVADCSPSVITSSSPHRTAQSEPKSGNVSLPKMHSTVQVNNDKNSREKASKMKQSFPPKQHSPRTARVNTDDDPYPYEVIPVGRLPQIEMPPLPQPSSSDSSDTSKRRQMKAKKKKNLFSSNRKQKKRGEDGLFRLSKTKLEAPSVSKAQSNYYKAEPGSDSGPSSGQVFWPSSLKDVVIPAAVDRPEMPLPQMSKHGSKKSTFLACFPFPSMFRHSHNADTMTARRSCPAESCSGGAGPCKPGHQNSALAALSNNVISPEVDDRYTPVDGNDHSSQIYKTPSRSCPTSLVTEVCQE